MIFTICCRLSSSVLSPISPIDPHSVALAAAASVKKKPIRNTLQQQQNWQSGNKNNTHRHREKEREREEERERDNGRAASRVRQAEFVAKVLQATEQVKYNNKQANALLYAARREYPVKSALLAFYFINFHRYLGHFSYKLFHY